MAAVNLAYVNELPQQRLYSAGGVEVVQPSCNRQCAVLNDRAPDERLGPWLRIHIGSHDACSAAHVSQDPASDQGAPAQLNPCASRAMPGLLLRPAAQHSVSGGVRRAARDPLPPNCAGCLHKAPATADTPCHKGR